MITGIHGNFLLLEQTSNRHSQLLRYCKFFVFKALILLHYEHMALFTIYTGYNDMATWYSPDLVSIRKKNKRTWLLFRLVKSLKIAMF